MEEKTFHESWYRIANQRICLRPSVRVQRQMFRGSKWYVLRDPFSNQFYRLRPRTYQFVSRLNASRTLEEVWKEDMSRDPENAPGQGDIIELLAQLYHANLLHYNLAANSVKLFERYKKKKQRIIKANLMNIMFFRIPLFDPDEFLKRLMPFIRFLLNPYGAAAWVLMLLLGLKVAIDNFAQLQVQSQGILSPSNLFLLYVGLVIIKTIHEFGHAFVVRRFDGEVHTMGVMFLIFNPLPYMDASAAWSFRNKWKRVLVGSAGMIFELFVAACAIIIWAFTGPGIIHSLAYNMVFIASVSTILFNINPLLRFDGYYILSDLLDMPNLHQQASQHLKYLVEHYAFGLKNLETPATNKREAYILTTFGILSGIYRIFVFSAILLFVADRFLLAGIIMALICAVAWVITPIVKLIQYLAASPRLYRKRVRAVTVCASTFAVIFGFLYYCPFPYNFKAPGVLKSVDYMVAVNKTSGKVIQIITPSGTQVQPGDPLLKMENPELGLKIRENQAGLDEARALHKKAMQEQQADLKPLASRIEFFNKRLKRLYYEQDQLVLRSDIQGIWISPNVKDFVGMWIPRGTPVGQLVNENNYYFDSVVAQADVSQLFSHGIRGTQVKLHGQANISIPVKEYTSIPMEQTRLPSAALGWSGGGEIAIDTTDNQGVKTAEPFYQVRATIDTDTNASLFHGRSGKIRFKLAAKPLLWQGWRKLRQLIQRRYQV